MKEYMIQHRVGRAKYLVSFHDGVKTHKDGSSFFDIKIFKSKNKLGKFIDGLSENGYREKP
jgi:hypothetical protein